MTFAMMAAILECEVMTMDPNCDWDFSQIVHHVASRHGLDVGELHDEWEAFAEFEPEVRREG